MARVTFFDYREKVCKQLILYGIKREHAELAVIDLKSEIIGSWQSNFDIKTASMLIIDDVRRIY